MLVYKGFKQEPRQDTCKGEIRPHNCRFVQTRLICKCLRLKNFLTFYRSIFYIYKKTISGAGKTERLPLRPAFIR